MLLRVDLAGHVGYWRFPGTVTFHDWLAACPWLHEGGTCVLRLPALSSGGTFVDAVAQSVYGLDQGFSHPRIEVLAGEEVAQGVRNSLAQRFGVDAASRPWQITNALSHLFMERPTVVVVTPSGAATGRDLWQEAVALREDMAKTDYRPTLTCVLMDNSIHRLDGRLVFDFRHGAPAFGVFETASLDSLQLWNAYVHSRLAWESAGDPSIAERMFVDVEVHLRRHHDEDLEHGLNEWARRELSRLPDAHRQALNAYLSNGSGGTAGLLEHGLIWRQIGSHPPSLAPWVARGLLLWDAQHPRRWLLRSALVCVPLSNELLARCQELEQHIKATCGDSTKVPTVSYPEEVVALWERFRCGRDETTVYPPGHPAPPAEVNDIWTFASLGQLLNDRLSPLRREPNESERRLARLRNTLAHGHYVCWLHVHALRQITHALT